MKSAVVVKVPVYGVKPNGGDSGLVFAGDMLPEFGPFKSGRTMSPISGFLRPWAFGDLSLCRHGYIGAAPDRQPEGAGAVAERRQRIGYERQLTAAVSVCR